MSYEELEEIINFLIQRTQVTTLYKVRAHANIIGNIIGNEEADTLANETLKRTLQRLAIT
jgi:hypothetical protein